MKRIRYSLSACISVVLLLSIGACGLPTEEEPAPDPAPVNPPTGVVDDSAGFYFRAQASDNYTYITHKGPINDFGSDCVAEEGDDIYCYVEAMEGDLYFHGIKLQYNVPSTMCDYVTVTPYYYFVFEPAPTACNVAVNIDLGTGTRDPLGAASCAQYVSSDGSDAYCIYDYSHESNPIGQGAGPNCCYGTYSVISDDGTGNTTETQTDWGGSPLACLGGPAMESQDLTASGLPKTDIFYVSGSGINDVYEVESPRDMEKSSTIYAANYYNSALYDHSTDDPSTTLTDGFPAGISRVRDFVADSEGAYTVSCLDRAFEVKARIQLFVREWNTKDEFEEGETGDPDETGVDPIEGQLNDFSDHDDMDSGQVNDRDKYPGTRE